MSGIIVGIDGKSRCWWCGEDPLYIRYHDEEWGRGAANDFRIFEKICLEGFQAGLSWITILKKRENFRKAFKDFDYRAIAKFNETHIENLMKESGIVRHKGKIESVINNAHRAIEMDREFKTLAAYFEQYRQQPRAGLFTKDNLAANPSTQVSLQMSKDLKKRGWTFVGPTTCYAFMQAFGLVNDHLDGCDFKNL